MNLFDHSMNQLITSTKLFLPSMKVFGTKTYLRGPFGTGFCSEKSHGGDEKLHVGHEKLHGNPEKLDGGRENIRGRFELLQGRRARWHECSEPLAKMPRKGCSERIKRRLFFEKSVFQVCRSHGGRWGVPPSGGLALKPRERGTPNDPSAHRRARMRMAAPGVIKSG